MVSSGLRLSLVASLAILCDACMGQTLDAGSTVLSKLGKNATMRATLTQMVQAVVMDGDDLYFTCEDGWVYSLSKNGSAPPQKVMTFPGNYAWGIAVDDSSVYVTALVDAEDGGVLLRAPKTGGSATTLAGALTRPWGVAVDTAQVYFMVQGASPYDGSDVGSPTPGSLVAMPKAGGNARVLAGGVVVGDVLALDETSVYWHESVKIRKVSKKGGPVTTLESSTVNTATSNLGVADGRLVWAESAGGAPWTISVVPTTGGASLTLEDSIARPSSLALAGDDLFWSDASGSSAGEIRSLTATGGDETVLSPQNRSAVGDDRVVSFVLADANMFYVVSSFSTPSLRVEVQELPR
jgi:hypothetical protein